MSLKMRGGQSKAFYTPVQRLDMPPLSKRKTMWKMFRHLLTPTWVTKRTNDIRAKGDQHLPPIPQPDNSRQLLNASNVLQRTPSLRSFSSIRPFTPTSLQNLDLDLIELVANLPSSNCLEKDLPPNQLEYVKSGRTLVSLPVLPPQQVEASAHQNSTFHRPRNSTDAKDAGGAVVVGRSSASTVPILPKVPLPRPVKPSTINLRSQLPPIGTKAQQLTTRPVTARTYILSPSSATYIGTSKKGKVSSTTKSTKFCTPVQLTGGKVERPTEIPPKEECEATPTGNPTLRKIIQIPSNPPPGSVDIDEFHLLDRLDVDNGSKTVFDTVTPFMCTDSERMSSDNDLLNMYRQDFERQEFERELEELKKTHGHLSLAKLHRFIRKRRKQNQQRREKERVRKYIELERKLEESQLQQIEMMAGMAKFAASQTGTSQASPSQNYDVSAGTKDEMEEEMRTRRRMKKAEKRMKKTEKKIEEFDKNVKRRAESKEKKAEKKAEKKKTEKKIEEFDKNVKRRAVSKEKKAEKKVEKKEQKAEQKGMEAERKAKKNVNGLRKSSKVAPQVTNCEYPTSSLTPALFSSNAISACCPPTGCPPSSPTTHPSTAAVGHPHHNYNLQSLSDHLARAELMEQQCQAKMVYPAQLFIVHEAK